MNGVLPSKVTQYCLKRSKSRNKADKVRAKADSNNRDSSDEDIKDFAETTMNELLGWYGYEKLDTRDTQALNLQRFTSANEQSSALSSKVHNSRKEIIITADDSHSASSPTSGSDGGVGGGNAGSDGNSSGGHFASPLTAESSTENGSENKDSAEEPVNVPPGCIVCAWCQKVGMKLFTLRTTSGCNKAFCSELCFTQCRRASFKKNKICDWCKHVRHTVNYVDFQDGEQQLQFCSNKCLNQYKMNIFCNETQAHLKSHPHLNDNSTIAASKTSSANLITPDLWLKDFKNSGDHEMTTSAANNKEDSDTDTDFENNSSPPLGSHLLKRKLTEFAVNNEQNDNISKEVTRKCVSRDKSSHKEFKRHKQSHNSHNYNKSANRISANGKHNCHIEWSHESRDRTPNFNSPPNEPNEFSAQSASIPIRSVGIHNPHIPILNGNSAPLRAPPLNGIAGNTTPAPSLFPRMMGNINREHIRPPLMPPFAGAPLPFGNIAPHMEMLLRMQNGFPSLRHPLPYPPHTAHTHPFGIPVGSHNSGQPQPPLLQPPLITPLQPSPYTNPSLLPPVTVMVPYPILMPLPIPIPIPLLFPFEKTSKNSNKESSKHNVNVNAGNTNGNVCSSGTSSKVENVITKLVERKTKVSRNATINVINDRNNDDSLDLSRKTVIYRNEDIDDVISDDSNDCSTAQNLVVSSRANRCVDAAIAANVSNGYRVQ